MINKMPHQDIEAEKMVISAILQEPDSLLRAADIIETGDFYSSNHRLIYAAFHELYKVGVKIEPITVRNQLKLKGNDEQIGGINYLFSCLDIMPTAANIKVHSRIIKDASIKRRIAAWLTQKQEVVSNGQAPHEILSLMESEIVGLSELIKSKRDPHAAGIMLDIVKYWEELKAGTKKFVQTDIKIGESIPGYFPGHLWMIGGYTSSGKSTYLAQTILDIAQWNGRCLVISTEDSREEKMMKLIANKVDIPQKYLLTGEIMEYQRESIARAMVEIKEGCRPIIYDDVRTADEIRLKAKKHKMQDDIQVVAIDYVQNLRGSGSLYERMSNAAETLFSMGRELGVTVIVLSQVNNDSAKEESPIIGLKGAGELAAAADIVLWLKRNKGFGKERELDVEVRKNRPFGVTGIIPMQFSHKYTKIEKRMEAQS